MCDVCSEPITEDQIWGEQIVSPATDIYAHASCYRESGRWSPNLLTVSLPGTQQRRAAAARMTKMTPEERSRVARTGGRPKKKT